MAQISIQAVLFGSSGHASTLRGPWSSSLEEAVQGFKVQHRSVSERRGASKRLDGIWDLYSVRVAVADSRGVGRHQNVDYKEEPALLNTAEGLLGAEYRIVT